MNKEKLIKELFDTVYQWGRVGIITDERCDTFQSMIKGLLEPQEERCICSQIKMRVDVAKKNNKELYLECPCGKAYMSVDRPQEEIEEIDIKKNFMEKRGIAFIAGMTVILSKKSNEHTKAINKINKINL